MEEASEEILGFYRNYHSAAGWATSWCCGCRCSRARPSWPTSTGASPTSWSAGSIRTAGPFPPERNDHPELPRLALRFDRFHFARLRQLIDAVNECTG